MHKFVLHLMVPGDIIWVHMMKNKDALHIAVQKGTDKTMFWKKGLRSSDVSMLNQTYPASGFYVPQVIAGHDQGRLYFPKPIHFGIMMSGHHNYCI